MQRKNIPSCNPHGVINVLFNRRAVQRGVDDVCRREGNCFISNNDRKQCPNCR